VSDAFLTALGWLPRAPADFKARCEALAQSSSPGTDLRALATHSLDVRQLERLARAISKLRANHADLRPLSSLKMGLLGNGTLDFLAAAVVGSGARHGLALECTPSGYDQFVQEALDPQSAVHRAAPEAVLLALDYRALPLHVAIGDPGAANAAVQAALAQLEVLRDGLHRHSHTTVIFATLATPPESLFGSFDRLLAGTLRSVILDVNRGIADLVAAHSDHCVLFDVAALAETVGTAEWFAPAQWHMAKLPFADTMVPLYADHLTRLLAALRGKSRRVLALDLDNTLWGGVIGDDGLEGILIGQGDSVGEAFLGVQRMALALRERGIVLAVSSKNEDAVARRPFREHPEMLLREAHIAVFQANWQDKASNLTAIAKALNLGLDTFVLLDDNPAERELVRRILPEVAVPELPEDPALYPLALSAAGYFEAVALSAEDRRRAAFYEGNARRVALQAEVGDLEGYLRSLQMEIIFQPFDAVGRARIAQLIGKSNQFNLTTRRYTEAQVAEIEHDQDAFTLQVRLTDTIGDNGMISVVICRHTAPETWTIDTWLMSCRVLGRGVEQMVLREIAWHAERAGIRRLVGQFRPTERNMMVREHYGKLGFTRLSGSAEGPTDWEIRLPLATPPAPMRVKRIGFAGVVAEPSLASEPAH
jgi:FkbH-like protein